MADLTAIKPCMLMYDIPERPPQGCRRLDNPSPRLRRIAIRLQLSVWVIPEGNIPYTHLDFMAANGATWDVARFDAENAESLISMGKKALKRDIDKAVDSLNRTVNTAARLLSEGELSAQEAEDRVSEARKRCDSVIADLTHAAQIFSISESDLPIESSYAAARVISTKMHERSRTYADAARRLAQEARASGNGGAAAIAAGALADDMPSNVLGDALIEATGDEDAAAPLLEAFAELPEAEPEDLQETDELQPVGPAAETVDWYARMQDDEY